jgi:RND family efflux transporter MFP subunit
MFKKKKTYVILVIIVLIIGSIFYFKNKKTPVQYTTQAAQKGNLAQTVSVTGKVLAPETLDLSFKLSGRIEQMYVDVGDHVTKGQKIATIDRGTLQSQLNQAVAAVKAQKELLDNMKAKKSSYTRDQRDNQRAQIAEAEAGVSAIMDQLKELTIYAPVDGTIIAKSVETGETITANSAAGNAPVVTIAQDGDLDIEANVPESDIVKVALGQKADINLDAFANDDIFPASVIKIDPSSTVIQDVVYYKVKLGFDHQDARFKNGMSADIDIKTAEKDNVVYIPERAIKTDGNGKYVEILKDAKTNAIDKSYVQTGLRGDDGMIEITNGLAGGENIITLTKN